MVVEIQKECRKKGQMSFVLRVLRDKDDGEVTNWDKDLADGVPR